MSLTVLFSLFMGLRTNFLYSTLLNSALEIKSSMLKARMEFDKNLEQPSEETVKRALGYLDYVEFNLDVVYEQKDKRNIIPIPINDVALKVIAQKFQARLPDYRALSLKISSISKGAINVNLKSEWETLFARLEEDAK
ncbi:MAG: hypothetical protein Q8K40_02730, partial [Ignavibacteria bacterium]|nr:hypothetical protein [Ignavibacteria bacterium]